MRFFRQEYSSGLPFPTPGDLPHPGIEPMSAVSLALQANSLPTEPLGKPKKVMGSGPYREIKWNLILALNSMDITEKIHIFKIQFSSVVQSCPTLCDPKDCSTPGFPVHHQLLELAQTHAHWVGDVIQPSYSLSSHSPPTFNLSQNQDLFQWVSSSHQVAKVLEFQLQHQSFQCIFRTDFL